MSTRTVHRAPPSTRNQRPRPQAGGTNRGPGWAEKCDRLRRATQSFSVPANIRTCRAPADVRGATQENARRVAGNLRCAVLLSFLSEAVSYGQQTGRRPSARTCNSKANLDRREEIVVTYVGGC